jgi:predicted PurR-regulated permease PerM
VAEPIKQRVDVTFATFFRLLTVVALAWIWLRLWTWFLLFVVAAFLAVALDPLVAWLDQRKIRRPFGSFLVVLLLAGVCGAFMYFAGASLKEQAGMLGNRMQEVQQQVEGRMPGFLKGMLQKDGSGQSPISGYAMTLGRALLSGLVSVGIGLILTVYLLLDGRRTYEWFVAFAPPAKRPRIHRSADAARQAIFGYLRGNVITSVIATVFTYVVLLLLKVPAALLLALLAGILNFIPVVGMLLSILPAFLLALTVSLPTALGVVGIYLAYNAIENYYLQPRVYGRAMRLSSLAVLAAFAAGAELAGVVGALIALPIAAMYPPLEKIWLRDRLDPAAVQDHERIESTDEH